MEMESHAMDRRRRPLNYGFCLHVHDTSHLLSSLVDHAASPTITDVVCCIGTRRRMSSAVRVFVSMHSSLLMMTMSRRPHCYPTYYYVRGFFQSIWAISIGGEH